MALHNGPQNFVSLKKFFDTHSISQLSNEDFASIISQLIDSTKFLLQGGIKLNRGEDILSKLDAILLILKLSIAVENLPVGDKKRDSIQLLQKETIEEIINSIKNINENSQRWCNPENFQGLDGVQYRSAHQRLLMINSLLFYYARTLHKNEKIQNFFERFIHFPLSIEKQILEKSSKQAANRTSGSSETEESMISCFLKDPVYGETSQFKSLKTEPQETYIDSDTGLELDFPLANRITIELDGDRFHFIQGKPKLEHLRKEKQLSENGWIRISLSTKMLNKYAQEMVALTTAVSATLNSTPVENYLEAHENLTALRNALRAQIKALHDKLKESAGVVSIGQGIQLKPRLSQSQKKKNKQNLFFSESALNLNVPAMIDRNLSKQLSTLLDLEDKISIFLGGNHLNKVINNDFLHKRIDRKFNLYSKKNELKNEKHAAALDTESETSKQNSPAWVIDFLREKELYHDQKLRDHEEKIKAAEKEFDTFLHTELHLEEFGRLIHEAGNVIYPCAEKKEQSIDAQINLEEESVRESVTMRV